MINSILRVPVYVCVATCLVEAIILLLFATQGRIGKAKVDEIAAVFYGVDRGTLRAFAEELREAPFVEPVALDALGDKAVLRTLDLDLRECAIEKGVVDLEFYESNLLAERERYNEMRLDFEQKVRLIGDTSSSRHVEDLRRALQVLPPAQAKDQIVRFFQSNDKEIYNDAVATIRTMPIDKQKKLFAEFKSEAEQVQLSSILRLIRLGVPEVPLIQSTRDELQQFDPNKRPPDQ